MDILSWNVKQTYNDGSEIDITGFPTKQSAENYIVNRNRIPLSYKIIPEYWEPAYRNNSGDLDLNVGI